MASGFFALFDDIAVLMDDVAVMSKVATRKTAGILADDLAVNAEKASGFVSSRELPVLWKITKGSFLNKIIILPVTFLLSAYFPVAITPILLVGGVYLAYEGAEKIYEYLFHRKDTKERAKVLEMTEAQASAYEKEKIKSAIIVDFILSIEIIIIALGTVINEPISVQVVVVTIVALLATVGVYGLVALLVRTDDLGYRLIAASKDEASVSRSIGTALVKALPLLVRGLGVLGTLAMILVAGGIFVHNIDLVHDFVHALPTILGEFVVGLLVGLVSLLVFKLFSKIKGAIAILAVSLFGLACEQEASNPPSEAEQFLRFSGNPVFRDDIPSENYEAASDPHVFFDEEGQRWMIYTGDPDENPGFAGIKLAKGSSWTEWVAQPSLLFEVGPSNLDHNKETPFYRQAKSGKHQIYYIGYLDNENYESQIFLAEADQLEGPYVQQSSPIVSRGLIADKKVEVITSPSVVEHDHELYLFFLGWDGFEDVTTVWVLGAKSSDEGRTWSDFQEVSVPIGTEGQVTAMPDGRFCAVRTGEYQGQDAILYATADHPQGPWVAQERPLIVKRDNDPLEINETIAPQITFDPVTGEPVLYYTGADYQRGWWIMMANKVANG